MGRTVYIDVSAKVENWTADSVIALTNGGDVALVVPASVKQEARAWLRNRFPGRKGSYHAYVLLAILIYLITCSEIERIEFVVIDQDYTGEGVEGKIKNELVPLLKRRQEGFTGRQVLFQELRGTRADRLAREVYKAPSRKGRRHISFTEIRAVFDTK